MSLLTIVLLLIVIAIVAAIFYWWRAHLTMERAKVQAAWFNKEFAQADSESAVHHEVRGETQSIPFVAPKPVSSRNASDDHNRWTGTPESMKVSKRDDYTQ